MKKLEGVVGNLSTNPFQTFSKKGWRSNSTFLSFDLSFDLMDESGNSTHVWFNRSFRTPPPIEEGDWVEVYGRFGQLGLIDRKNFYASKIIDRQKNALYTLWRNKTLSEEKHTS